MSFSVGSGFLNAEISLERLHNIKENALPPEMSLWEKIKHFFCSTRQDEALNCIYRLYHHEQFQMSEQDIRETFIQLKQLASPGSRNRFIIDRNNDNDIYKINEEVILSRPRTDDIHRTTQNDWSDCDEVDDDWHDCTETDDVWHDCMNEYPPAPPEQQSISVRHQAILVSESITAEQKKKLLDNHYFHSVIDLLDRMQVRVETIGRHKIIAKVGYFKSISLATTGARIMANINSPNANINSLRKDIATVLNAPGVLDIIPPDIINEPEFNFIKHYSMQVLNSEFRQMV